VLIPIAREDEEPIGTDFLHSPRCWIVICSLVHILQIIEKNGIELRCSNAPILRGVKGISWQAKLSAYCLENEDDLAITRILKESTT